MWPYIDIDKHIYQLGNLGCLYYLMRFIILVMTCMWHLFKMQALLVINITCTGNFEWSQIVSITASASLTNMSITVVFMWSIFIMLISTPATQIPRVCLSTGIGDRLSRGRCSTQAELECSKGMYNRDFWTSGPIPQNTKVKVVCTDWSTVTISEMWLVNSLSDVIGWEWDLSQNLNFISILRTPAQI